MSDAFAVRDLVTHGFARDPRDAAFRALTAGLNMDMASKTLLSQLPALVADKSIPISDIDDAVRPLLAAKIRMQLFERPYADASRTEAVLNAPEHRQVARVAAQRSAVLLRNQGHLLPLDKEQPPVDCRYWTFGRLAEGVAAFGLGWPTTLGRLSRCSRASAPRFPRVFT